MARIGLLGGTFNPPHLGHLVCAQEAHRQLGLDRVLLMPANVPPHKAVAYDPGVEARIELCRRAVGDDPRFGVSRAEAERPGPSYTVDTLRRLHAERPDDELTFIMGGDMAHALRTWREPEAILELAEVAVAERDGLRAAELAGDLAGLRGVPERLRFFAMPRIDLSSSELRRRLAAGAPARFLIPDAVLDHVRAAGLYRAEVAA